MSTKTYLYKRADTDNTKRAQLVDASEYISNEFIPEAPNDINYGVEHKPLLNFIGDILSNGAKLTITNDKMDFIKLPLSNDFTPEILDYFYDGECQTITSPISKYAVFNYSTYQLRVLHGASDFSTYNKERKIVFRNLPK